MPRYHSVKGVKIIHPWTENIADRYRTHITNINAIASVLCRPPDLIMKWFELRLRIPARYDPETRVGVVQTQLTLQKVNECLSEFIHECVVCSGCKSLDTTLRLKHRELYIKCNADYCCSHRTEMNISKAMKTYIIALIHISKSLELPEGSTDVSIDVRSYCSSCGFENTR